MIDDVDLSEALHTSAPVVLLGTETAVELRSLAEAVGDRASNTRRRRIRQLLVGVVLAALVSGGATASYATGALDPFFAKAPFRARFSDVTATASATPATPVECTIELRAASFSGGHRATLREENRYLSTLTLREVRASPEYRSLERDARRELSYIHGHSPLAQTQRSDYSEGRLYSTAIGQLVDAHMKNTGLPGRRDIGLGGKVACGDQRE